DIGLERVLTNVRYAMLTAAAGGEETDEHRLAFFCAVARQCFINDYVFSLTADEAAQAQRLRTVLEQALASGAPCPALWPVAVGAYFPLHALTNAQTLCERTLPDCVNAVIVQQVKEPALERQIAATIPALTSIDSTISREVRQQYEESPYPRWTKAGPSPL